jgi:hypothetical protein
VCTLSSSSLIMVVMRIKTEISKVLVPLKSVLGVSDSITIRCSNLGGVDIRVLGLDQLALAEFYFHPTFFQTFQCSDNFSFRCSLESLVTNLSKFDGSDVVTLFFDNLSMLTLTVEQNDLQVKTSITATICRDVNLAPRFVVFPVEFEMNSSTLAKLAQFGGNKFEVQVKKDRTSVSFTSDDYCLTCEPSQILKKDLCCSSIFHAQPFRTFITQGAAQFEHVQISCGPDLPIKLKFVQEKNYFTLVLSCTK